MSYLTASDGICSGLEVWVLCRITGLNIRNLHVYV